MTKKETQQIADAVIARLQELGVIPTQPVRKLLTINEAASFLKISASAIYKNNNIPRVKRGKRLYFTEESLSQYVQQG